ncbi:5a7e112b-f7e6-4b14-8619-5b46ad6565a2 [Sclerotinia trifoliorum]|uniref:5a7e112b-f7e6-4b14-8619-5b46ad6565a2 n=1 Tax=Sclerotinia trifoliorum TaxID=28548 RepID=A0A8H2VY42_9HELO|nr:5a7e112b-f7e6-4b14-8619-5b46ad6565a2 [Sclerotinia trifoliorum]
MAGTKRARSPSPSFSHLYSNKRSNPVREGRVDPVYGQRSALPADDDSVSLDEDGLDALSYLRSVRAEAGDLPLIFYAPAETRSPNDGGEYDRSIYESGLGDFRGYYEDGAYFAAAEVEDDIADEQDEGQDPQLAYFNSIITRFEILREQMQQIPPPNLVKDLDVDHPIYLTTLNTKLCRWWRWKLKTVDPLPAQVASMDKDTVLRLLRLLTSGTLLQNGSDINMKVSRWAWALLARLPVRGELSSDEIGVVRELGKKAVMLGVGLKAGNGLKEELDEVEKVFDADNGFEIEDNERPPSPGDENVTDGVEDHLQVGQLKERLNGATQTSDLTEKSTPSIATDKSTPQEEASGSTLDSHELEAIKARLLANLTSIPSIVEATTTSDPQPPKEGEYISSAIETPTFKLAQTADWNTRATIDMIITIAGEIYGQRDLLEFREVWGE